MMWPWTKRGLYTEYETLATISKGRRTEDQTKRLRELVRKLSPDTKWTRWCYIWRHRKDPLFIEIERMRKEYNF